MFCYPLAVMKIKGIFSVTCWTMLPKRTNLSHLKWLTSTKEDTLAWKHNLPPYISSSFLLKQNKASKQTTTTKLKASWEHIGELNVVSAAVTNPLKEDLFEVYSTWQSSTLGSYESGVCKTGHRKVNLRFLSNSNKKAKLMEMGTTSCIFFTPKQLHLYSF